MSAIFLMLQFELNSGLKFKDIFVCGSMACLEFG
jgi:hypothetical protein